MAFSKTCWECGRAFNDPSNFRRHIKTCGKAKAERGHFKCPYCPSTWARREDVLTKHIVYKHTDKVGEVVKDKAKIQYISPQLPRKYTVADETADIIMLEKLDKQMRPFLGGSAEEREELNAQLEERNGNNKQMRVVETSEGLDVSQKHVRLSTESNNSQEMDTTLDTEQDMSPHRDDDLVVHTDGQKVDESHQSPGLEVTGEPVGSITTVPDPNSPYVPDCESAAAQTEGRKFSHEDLINVCPHGTRLPVHEHRYRMKICLDGTKEVTCETLVHCAACPRPSLKIDYGQF